MINQHKEEYLKGWYHNDYEDCRYAVDKVAYAKQWFKNNKPDIDFENPKNLVDRICIEKMKDIENPDMEYLTLKSRWADKVNVYDELEKLGMKEIQLPYIWKGYTKTFKEEHFDLMDKAGYNKYIIKCNHGSGWNIFYTPGESKKENIIENINRWLDTNYAYLSGLEMQYKWIKPGYVIQPVEIFKPLDWSFWCENGKIEGLGLTKKCGKNFEEYIAFVDENGKYNKWFIGSEPEEYNLNTAQMNILEKMKPYVLKLIKPFNFVRCDMYCMNGHIYFGELTFTPCSGVLDITYN